MSLSNLQIFDKKLYNHAGETLMTENNHFSPEEPVIPNDILDDNAVADFSDLHKDRLYRAKNIETYDLPDLPEDDIKDTYLTIEQGERQLVSPNLLKQDYDDGTAAYSDEIAYLAGHQPILFTAEHATAHYRQDTETDELRRKGPDLGTAGLGYALRRETAGHLLAMIGKQTGDANYQEQHVFKDRLEQVIALAGIKKVVSLHGMAAGKFSDVADERAFDVLLGIGDRPDDPSIDLAERIQKQAQDLGLRVATNEWFVKVADDDPLIIERNPDGTVAFDTFSAPYYTTRAFVQTVSEARDLGIASVEVELSGSLRYMPNDIKRSMRNRHVGAYVGFSLLYNALTDQT